MSERVSVLIIDSHEIFCKNLAKNLERDPRIYKVWISTTGPMAIDLAIRTNPDIVICDTSSITECDYVKATRIGCRMLPDTKIVILTNSEQEDHLFSVLCAGAKAYVRKSVGIEYLIDIIFRVRLGEFIIAAPMATKLLKEFSMLEEAKCLLSKHYSNNLSRREKEVLVLAANGLTNREVGQRLYVAETTVKAHMRNIMEKIHVRNRQQAAVFAAQYGLLMTENTVPYTDNYQSRVSMPNWMDEIMSES